MKLRRLLPLMAVLLVTLAACNPAYIKPLPPPPKVKTLPTTTTFPDFSGTSIPPVRGTTTTAPPSLFGGTASLHGHATIGGAPAAGADVRIDRFVNDQSTGTDVIAGPDGSWSVGNLLGGRFRIRSYLPPTATLTQPVVVFVNNGQSQDEELQLTSFSGALSVTAAIAPNPPNLDDVANVAVQVTTAGVDSSGVARSIGQPGLSVLLVSGGGMNITTPNPQNTNSNGVAQWTILCTSLNSAGLTAVLPDGSQHPLNLPGCHMPPPVTAPATTTSTTP